MLPSPDLAGVGFAAAMPALAAVVAVVVELEETAAKVLPGDMHGACACLCPCISFGAGTGVVMLLLLLLLLLVVVVVVLLLLPILPAQVPSVLEL
jgi:hypothetical protein